MMCLSEFMYTIKSVLSFSYTFFSHQLPMPQILIRCW